MRKKLVDRKYLKNREKFGRKLYKTEILFLFSSFK